MAPSDPETLLTRSELSDVLTKRGYPTPVATLATLASRGGGPRYRVYGRLALYKWGDAKAWAENRLSAPRAAASERVEAVGT
jgi:hypothetical protein